VLEPAPLQSAGVKELQADRRAWKVGQASFFSFSR
jgi:hypothetical protein